MSAGRWIPADFQASRVQSFTPDVLRSGTGNFTIQQEQERLISLLKALITEIKTFLEQLSGVES